MGFEQFDNTAKLEDIPGEKSKMRLLEDISFTGSGGTVWTAPAGSIVDGASIPRFFWRFIGSPFAGHYLRASVIHDVYCQTKSMPHKSVHMMFKEAMRADGVSKMKSRMMFKSVWFFGPKW